MLARSQRRSTARSAQGVGGSDSEGRPAPLEWLDARGLGSQLLQLLKAYSEALPRLATDSTSPEDASAATVSQWQRLIQVR